MYGCGRKCACREDTIGLPRCHTGIGAAVYCRNHRIIFAAALLIFALCPLGYCEEQAIIEALELEPIVGYAGSQAFDFIAWMRFFIDGEGNPASDISELFSDVLHQAVNQLKNCIRAVLFPLLASSVLRFFVFKDGSVRRTASFICRVCCIPALSASFVHLSEMTEQLLSNLLRCAELLSPVLIAAVSLSGADASAVLLSPMMGACAQIIQNLFTKWGIALSCASVGLAIAGSLSSYIKLNRLHSLIRQILHWGVGGVLTAFMAILTLQGRLAAGRDNAAARTARYAIENLIPIIGGNVSDSLDSLLSTANIVKNALGASGIVLLAYTCLSPLVRLFLHALILRLLSSISEPMGDENVTSLLSQFADGTEMLLITLAASVTLCCMLAGSCISSAANFIH